MRKDEVETHSTSNYGGPYHPAVNVKYYGLSHESEVQEKFGCTEKVARRALQWQLESAQGRFWEGAQEWAEECFGKGVDVWPAGRSDGWAVVEGLPDLDGWDAIQLSKWAKFTKMCSRGIKYLTSEEMVIGDIASNRWAEENSEEYNYYDKADGSTVCLADVPRCAHCEKEAPRQ